MNKTTLKWAILAVLALLAGAAFAGYPVTNYLPPDALAALGAVGAMPFAMSGEVTLLEVKKIIEEQGTAFEQFKKANDELIKAKAEGKAVADLQAKVDTLSAALDKFADIKEALEELQKKANRPDLGTDNQAKALAEEVKTFNMALRADLQLRGKAMPVEFDAKTYADYKSAFFKVNVGVKFEHLNSDEQKALQAGSDPDGGYFLPHSTTGRTVTKLFEQSIMRQICDVQTISTAKTDGIVDNNEADAGWVAELGTRSDTTTPQVGKWEIEAFEMYAMPKASQKILDDAATDVEGWLAGKVADKFARVEGTAFWAGTGVGQARGLATYTTVSTGDDTRAWGQFQYLPTGASGDFHTTKMDVLHDVQGAFKDQYLNNAQWVMRREARTKLRKMKESTSDRYLWEPSNQVGQPERLNGYPVRIDQYMPAIAANSLSAAFGDFKQAYTIVDRMGIRTLRDPFTAKPYVVFYTTKRTGGGAMNYEAVKFIKFSAT